MIVLRRETCISSNISKVIKMTNDIVKKFNLTSLCDIVRQKYGMPKLSVQNQESDKNKENHWEQSNKKEYDSNIKQFMSEIWFKNNHIVLMKTQNDIDGDSSQSEGEPRLFQLIDKIIEFIESFRMKSLLKNDNSDSTISSDDYNKDMSLNKLNLNEFELHAYLQKVFEVWVKSLQYALEQTKTEDINTIEYLLVILSILESKDKLEIHPSKYFSFIPYMTLSKLLFYWTLTRKF